MATRNDTGIAETMRSSIHGEEAPCTLSEAVLTVLSLLAFIIVPAAIGLIALKLVSAIVKGLGYEVLTF